MNHIKGVHVKANECVQKYYPYRQNVYYYVYTSLWELRYSHVH